MTQQVRGSMVRWGSNVGVTRKRKMLGGVRRVHSSGCYEQIACDNTIIIACLVTKFK